MTLEPGTKATLTGKLCPLLTHGGDPMSAHNELRARLDDYRRAVATYESPDPYDREEARYEAMHAARARLCDLALAEALMAEYDRVVAERDRLRKLFDDAGDGEYNVLALIDFYQQEVINADERLREAYPRALQAAADVVLARASALADESVDPCDAMVKLDALADSILDLTEEQIEAVDAVQKEVTP